MSQSASDTDPIEQIADAVEKGTATVSITELPTRVKVGIRAEKGSDYFAAINGDEAKQAEEFLSAYTDAIRDLYHLHTEREHDTPEWCYEVGEVIYRLREEENRTKSEVEHFLKPLAAHDNISFSKWKMFNVENVYALFPDKESLPDVELDGGGSKFGLLCGHVDTPEELHDVFDRVPPADIAHIERKTWNYFRVKDDYSLRDVAARVNRHGRDDWGTDTISRRVTAVKRVYRMLDEGVPNDAEIQDALEATRDG